MSYAPINVYVYFQAFSGAVAGLLGQSTPLTTERGAYADTLAIAGAWAQEVDTQWGDSTNPDLFEYEEILNFSAALFLDTNPQASTGDTTPGSGTNPATYTQSAAALMTILSDAEVYLANQGIIPPPIPGEGGGAEGFTYVSANATVAENASKIVVLASAGTVRLTLPALTTLPDGWLIQVTAQGCTSPIVVNPPTGTIWDPSMGTFNGTATLPNGAGGTIAWWQFDKTNSRFVQIV